MNRAGSRHKCNLSSMVANMFHNRSRTLAYLTVPVITLAIAFGGATGAPGAAAAEEQTVDERSVPDELREAGGTITVTAGGESMNLEVPKQKVEVQKVPGPYCSYKAKKQTVVHTYARSGVKGFGGSKAALRCGNYGKAGWGLRHIGENHKKEWQGKASGGDWYALMEFANKQVLKKPEKAPRQANDTYAYCAPVELKHNGKVYDRFKVIVPVSHKGKNIITSFTSSKCK